MQAQITGDLPARTVFTTVIVLAIMTIAYLTLMGIPMPFLGSERAAFVAIAVLGFGMCAVFGIGSAVAPGQWTVTSTIASVLGVLALLTIVAVIAGWTAILDPIGQVVYGGSASLDRIGILSLTVLIAVMWFLSTLRQLGLTGAKGS